MQLKYEVEVEQWRLDSSSFVQLQLLSFLLPLFHFSLFTFYLNRWAAENDGQERTGVVE